MIAHEHDGLDGARRALGSLLDQCGWGARETPSVVVHRAPGARLKCYGGDGPAVLLVPAPIKRAYIWDLAPECSVVARLRAGDCRVYVLEWLDPLDDRLGLGDYADRLIGECVGAVAADSGLPRVVLLGHSLGGTLAAIYATLHPERVLGLVVLGTPLHFAADVHVLVPTILALVAATWPARRVPGAMLTALTVAAAPFSVGAGAWLDRLVSLADAEARNTLQRVERWALDEMALPGALVADLLQAFYRDDAFVTGTLAVRGRPAAPAQLSAPVLAIADPRCALAPPGSVEPFLRAVASTDTELWRYEGDTGVLLQHAGMLVGRSAHRTLWPRVVGWIRARAERAVQRV